jgi:hypothetical protein
MDKEKNRHFVKAEEGVPPAGYENPSVRYYDKKGNLLVRYEGTKAWRCNNPGNIKYVKGGFAMRHGAIGFAMGFSVFPNEFSGRVALRGCFKKNTSASFWMILAAFRPKS